jgi:hypothetical protein
MGIVTVITRHLVVSQAHFTLSARRGSQFATATKVDFFLNLRPVWRNPGWESRLLLTYR